MPSPRTPQMSAARSAMLSSEELLCHGSSYSERRNG
jgi:hypothetical protein